MKKPIFFLNNKFITAAEAKIPVTDLTVQRGYGVFETLRTYKKKPFRLEKHLERLFRSAKLIELQIPFSVDFLKNKILETLAKNNYPDSSVKIIITGGNSKNTISPSSKPSLCILVTPVHPYPKSCYSDGISLITFPHVRFLPECKNLNYSTAVLAQLQARKTGASEALYLTSDGFILEATTSNFFLVQNQKIITPKNGILDGITRQEVVKIAQDLKISCLEKELRLTDFKHATEAFITSSIREIMPVVQVDKIKIGNGKPGNITLKLLREYRARVNL